MQISRAKQHGHNLLFPSVLTRNMIQGDKAGLGGGRGPGCICMGIWERKKSKGLILQTLNWVNKRNLARGLHTGLKVYGVGPQCCCLDSQFLHCTIKFTFYLLLPAMIFTSSTLNKVKKPWVTELKLQQTSFTLSSCATNASVCVRWPKFYFSPCAYCVLIIKRWNQAL